MKIDKQSNLYIVLYITVLVIIVGTALAFTSTALRPRQQENIEADKMKQILASLHITPQKDSIRAEFGRIITEQFAVDSRGSRIGGADAFAIDIAAQVKLPQNERQLPVYKAQLPGGTVKWVLPAYGAGLWGPIWGYVALDNDGSTIYGAYFSHQGETPGLGAEIAKPAFTGQFDGKRLFKNGVFRPVEVIKKGLKPTGDGDYVDGVSGGTITSKGVGEMLDNCLAPYEAFLETLQ